jgi:glyoxylase-like metal-dependent hydrolase (beta-lactamase superfamily II)
MIKLGSSKDGWTRYYCTVCGHVEWVAPGEQLQADYHCPLCGEGRSVMLSLDDARLARHEVEFKQIAPEIYQAHKRPPFRADFTHYSYLINHPEGLILYDAPPLVTEAALGAVLRVGRPRLLVVSHQDFVGLAGDWAEALAVPSWMGDGDAPLAGNRFEPGERVSEPRAIADDMEVVRVGGHSTGSLALYWRGAPGGPVLASGDALTLWDHGDGKIQLTFFQDPPASDELKRLSFDDVSLLLTCGGALADASGPLRQLSEAGNQFARPYKNEPGGVWLDASEVTAFV